VKQKAAEEAVRMKTRLEAAHILEIQVRNGVISELLVVVVMRCTTGLD
jgi:hypothetical protein